MLDGVDGEMVLTSFGLGNTNGHGIWSYLTWMCVVLMTFIRARFPSFWEDKPAKSGGIFGNNSLTNITNIANINFIADLHNYQHPRDSGSGIMSSKSYANCIILA